MPETKMKTAFAEVTKTDEGARTITALASTGCVDRSGETIDPAAFKQSLGTYRRNPVLLAGHVYASESGEPTVIGKVLKIAVTQRGLPFEARFAETDLADQYWQLYQGGFMRAFSVGFLPKKWESRRMEIDGEYRAVRAYTEVELLEISAVAVPANAEALSRMAQQGNAAASMALQTIRPAGQPRRSQRTRQPAGGGARGLIDGTLRRVEDQAYAIQQAFEEQVKGAGLPTTMAAKLGDGLAGVGLKLQGLVEEIMLLRGELADPGSKYAKALLSGEFDCTPCGHSKPADRGARRGRGRGRRDR